MYEFLRLPFDLFGCGIVGPSGSLVDFTIYCTIMIYSYYIIMIISRVVKSLLHITNITPLVINSLGGGHTHKHTRKHTYRHSRTEAIIRKQACTGCTPGLKSFHQVKEPSLHEGLWTVYKHD